MPASATRCGLCTHGVPFDCISVVDAASAASKKKGGLAC